MEDPRHPYASVFMSIDPETWEGWTMVAFDRKGKLWKIWQWGVCVERRCKTLY